LAPRLQKAAFNPIRGSRGLLDHGLFLTDKGSIDLILYQKSFHTSINAQNDFGVPQIWGNPNRFVMKERIDLQKIFTFTCCLFVAVVLLLIKKMMIYNGF